MSREDYLFTGNGWFAVEQHLSKELEREAGAYNPDKLLNTSADALTAYFAGKFHMDLPLIDDEAISFEAREAEIDVSRDRDYQFSYGYSGTRTVAGMEYEFHIPFSGDASLFTIQPTTHNMNPPRARVRGSSIVFSIKGPNLQGQQVDSQAKAVIGEIKQHLQWLSASTAAWNGNLPERVRVAVEARRNKLMNDRNNAGMLSFKMRERSDVPKTYAAPEVRRKVAPVMPPASSAPWKPEPALEMAQYEHILKVISDAAKSWERSPSAIRAMSEEDLRTQFLFALNGHFEGGATGETFNKEGKTDILIHSQGKNIFIAECKIWGGARVLSETIDQLLGYVSWRDTKVAIILFNRNKDFTAVLDQVQSVVERHPNCKRFMSRLSESQFRFVFSQRDDPNREMTLTVLAFDVPSL